MQLSTSSLVRLLQPWRRQSILPSLEYMREMLAKFKVLTDFILLFTVAHSEDALMCEVVKVRRWYVRLVLLPRHREKRTSPYCLVHQTRVFHVSTNNSITSSK